MKLWLDVCREAVGDIKAVLVELPTRVEREPVLQTGVGGDDTTAIDAAAETAVVHRLEALDLDFTLVSEELGERVFGTGAPWRVVCDPIDGSLNAKRDIPFFSLSLAVADGEREREEGNVALGVQRAVDRVADDDPRLPAPEDALAELLRDEREALVERLEPVHDGRLRRRVDRGRVVAALAQSQHGLALDAGRQLREYRLDVSHSVAADVEPRLHKGWKSRPEINFGKK